MRTGYNKVNLFATLASAARPPREPSPHASKFSDGTAANVERRKQVAEMDGLGQHLAALERLLTTRRGN
jgi:hypothetical protein